MKTIDQLMKEADEQGAAEPSAKVNLPVPVGERCIMDRSDRSGEYWGIVVAYGNFGPASHRFQPGVQPYTHAVVIVPHVMAGLGGDTPPMGVHETSQCTYIVDIDELSYKGE